jgi:hypothetical protein
MHRVVTPPDPCIDDPYQMQNISVASVVQACDDLLDGA